MVVEVIHLQRVVFLWTFIFIAGVIIVHHQFIIIEFNVVKPVRGVHHSIEKQVLEALLVFTLLVVTSILHAEERE